MYVYTGQEPPFIEQPDPRFGEVIIKLNEMTNHLQHSVTDFNQSTRNKLDTFTREMTSFIDQVVNPITAHMAIVGAAHNETSKNIGLDLKDNYRTATLAEQRDLAPVLAYVTPQGAKAAMKKNNDAFDPNGYQMNDVFHFASYFYPDEYPVGIPVVVQDVRYFSTRDRVTLLTNGDRLVASPVSDQDRYQKQSIFVSGPQNIRRKTQMSEIQNLNTNYIGSNWNAMGAQTAEGKTALFKPLADKKIYEMKNALGMTGGNQNFLLFGGYGSAAYKGLATAVSAVGTVVTLQHRFFKTNLLETDPTLTDLVDSNYAALFTQINQPPYSAPANGQHSYDLSDFLGLDVGQTVELDGEVVTALTWNVQDYEIYCFVAIPALVRQGTESRKLVISFIESIIPGKLTPGNSATFRQLGTLVKDFLDEDLLPLPGSQWVKVSHPTDMNNPVLNPGVILPSGEVVKCGVTRNALRIKRMESGFDGLKSWMLGDRPVIDIKAGRTEVFPPSRYTPLGAIPERVLPVLHNASGTYYLIYALDRASGQYSWKKFAWAPNSMVRSQTTDRFGLNMAVVETPFESPVPVPRSLSVCASLLTDGVTVRGLAFTNENQYKGFDSVAFVDDALSVGRAVKLSAGDYTTLLAGASMFLERAKAVNPGTDYKLRKSCVQVFALTGSRAVVMLSDGVNYAEVCVSPYTVANGVFSLIPPAGGHVFVKVTPARLTALGKSRQSQSGDGVWQVSSDLLALQTTATSFDVTLTRPFGELYGDLGFTVNDINIRPTIVSGKSNPARLYQNVNQIDLVDELHPPLLIPRKGLYQFDPSNTHYSTLLTDTARTLGVDPYEINEAGWVRIPAGSRVILSGHAYILDREYPIQVNPTGKTYCYLIRRGDVLQAVGSPVLREPANSEVLFGEATNGVLTINHSYLVLDKHVLSSARQGSAVPVFDEDGAKGVNKFFTRRDLI